MNVEVSTVDGFQGREKEVIVISMVRSNPKHTIGFLSNERRMNVAVTRAKRLCALICDSGTVNKDKFLRTLTKYFKEYGIARSAFDYQGNEDVRMMYGMKATGTVVGAGEAERPKAAATTNATDDPMSTQKKGLSQKERKKMKQQKKKEEEMKVGEIEE